MGLTPVARSYRQYSRHYCKLVFKNGSFETHTCKKMRLSNPKTDSVNVAMDSFMLSLKILLKSVKLKS